MKKFKRFFLFSIFPLLISLNMSSATDSTGPNKEQIENAISLCKTKLGQVTGKNDIFKYPSKSGLLNFSGMKEWKEKVKRIDDMKKSYDKQMNQFQAWFEKNKISLRISPPRKAQEMVVEFVHNCNLFADGIGDFLYWVQGKKPPGGFKNGVTAAYFEKLLNR